MRTCHFRVSPTDIQRRASYELRHLLPWQDGGRRLPVDLIVRLLWMMTTLRASLHGLWQRFGLACSLTTLRAGITSQLPPPDELALAFGSRLRALIPREPRQGFRIAIDTHWVCFYGQRRTRGLVRGSWKAGTHRFFVYATAVVVEAGRRYTLAVTPVESNRPEEALVPLLAQIRAAGIRVRILLLDKGFFATQVFEHLHACRIPFVAAVPHRRAHLKSLWTDPRQKQAILTMTPGHHPGRSRRPVSVSLVRVRVPDRRRRRRRVVQVYAHGGLGASRHLGSLCVREYQARFGIESSYRQLNQAKPKTTSKDRTWRLLLIGLALLYRQLWVFLEQAFQRPPATDWSPETALERLRHQLAQTFIAGLIDRNELSLKPADAAFWNNVFS